MFFIGVSLEDGGFEFFSEWRYYPRLSNSNIQFFNEEDAKRMHDRLNEHYEGTDNSVEIIPIEDLPKYVQHMIY